MRKIILILMTVLVAFGCNKSKKMYNRTIKICSDSLNTGEKSLYVEVYHVGLLNNLTSEYLTDSINFRIYTGTFDDEEGYIYYKCDKYNVNVEKRAHVPTRTGRPDTLIVVDKKVYNFKALRQQHKFE